MFNRKKKQIEDLQLEIAKGAAREAEYFRQNNELQRQVAAANREILQQIKRINELGKFYKTEEPTTGVTEAVIVKPEDLVFRKMLPDKPTSEILNNNKHIILAQIVNRLIDKGYVQFTTTEDPVSKRQAIEAKLFVIPWDKMVTDRVCVFYDR